MAIGEERTSFLRDQFKQDLEQYRHVENQRWKLFLYFLGLNPTLLTLITALRDRIPSIFPSAAFALVVLSFFWASFVSYMFVKWRLEFILHIIDANRIRTKFQAAGPAPFLVWTNSEPSFLKLESVFMGTIYIIVGTSGIMSTLLMYLVFDYWRLSTKVTAWFQLSQIIAVSVGWFVSLTILEFTILWAIQTQRHEKRVKIRLFEEDESKNLKMLVFIIGIAELGWLLLVMLIPQPYNVAILCICLAPKLLLYISQAPTPDIEKHAWPKRLRRSLGRMVELGTRGPTWMRH